MCVCISVLEGADAWRSDTINVPSRVVIYSARERERRKITSLSGENIGTMLAEDAGIDIHYRGLSIK